MASIPVKSASGSASGSYDVKDELLETEKGLGAMQEAVKIYLGNQRQGSASTKHKADVAGSNRKLWKQKGTGRARTGFRQSPIWRGGGIVFGPKPRDYTRKMPKKAARLAFKRAFTEKVNAEKVTILDGFSVSTPKTKEIANLCKNLDFDRTVLFISASSDANLELSTRNLPRLELAKATDVNTYQLLRYDQVLIQKDAMEALEQRLGS